MGIHNPGNMVVVTFSDARQLQRAHRRATCIQTWIHAARHTQKQLTAKSCSASMYCCWPFAVNGFLPGSSPFSTCQEGHEGVRRKSILPFPIFPTSFKSIIMFVITVIRGGLFTVFVSFSPARPPRKYDTHNPENQKCTTPWNTQLVVEVACCRGVTCAAPG